MKDLNILYKRVRRAYKKTISNELFKLCKSNGFTTNTQVDKFIQSLCKNYDDLNNYLINHSTIDMVYTPQYFLCHYFNLNYKCFGCKTYFFKL